MTICLQGGNEFSPRCREMDADLVRRAGGGPVVVNALAGAPGRDYATAAANGVAHFEGLGAGEVVAAPDARKDPGGSAAACARARLLVLPGGSPRRLLEALRDTGLVPVLQDLLDGGAVVMGSSAGAMVLGEWTVLPGRPVPRVTRGLGLVPGTVVVPHWTGEGRSNTSWLRVIRAAVPPDTAVLGIPEESGLLVLGAGAEVELTAVGSEPSRLVSEDRDLPLGGTWRRP